MRTISELEQVIENVSSGTPTEIYDAIESMDSGVSDLAQTYQTILEIVVNDVLKVKNKK